VALLRRISGDALVLHIERDRHLGRQGWVAYVRTIDSNGDDHSPVSPTLLAALQALAAQTNPAKEDAHG
jgi:hypothetical protein